MRSATIITLLEIGNLMIMMSSNIIRLNKIAQISFKKTTLQFPFEEKSQVKNIINVFLLQNYILFYIFAEDK